MNSYKHGAIVNFKHVIVYLYNVQVNFMIFCHQIVYGLISSEPLVLFLEAISKHLLL